MYDEWSRNGYTVYHCDDNHGHGPMHKIAFFWDWPRAYDSYANAEQFADQSTKETGINHYLIRELESITQ